MQAPGWKLSLPAPRQKALKDFRVALWLEDPNSAVDRSITDKLQAIGDRLAKLGAKVDAKARPKFDTRRSHEIFLKLMLAVVTARSPQEAFDKAKAAQGGLKADDLSFGAMATRATVLHHREWIAANEERTKQRWAWHEFFKDHDVVLTPMAAVPTFKHDHSEPQTERRLQVNGKSEAYLDQLFWAGLAGGVLLPATVAPAGLSPEGLPVGVQIIGAEMSDRTTIEFARLLAAEIGGFTPPPGYGAAA